MGGLRPGQPDRRHLIHEFTTDPGQITDRIDRAIAEAARLTHTGPTHRRYHVPVGRLRWAWSLVDEATTPPTEIAFGRAWTKRRAERRSWAAYNAELDRLATARSGLLDRTEPLA